MKVFRITLLVLLLASAPVLAGDAPPFKASKGDKCPVCGMFVAKYTDFLAQIIFKDGSYALFDGAKDMFKDYLDLQKYHPAKQKADIVAIYVTEYYSMRPTDGRNAYYVVGSNVYGPMGHELIPFEKEEDAKEFMTDHSGEKIIRFGDVTTETINSLD